MENLKHDVLAKCNDDTDISENVVCRDSIEQERKARRIKLEEVRSTKRKGRSRTRRNRALLDSQRKDNRRALYIARWHNFLMDEGDVVADEVNAVLSQRLESSISTPELLNDEYSSLIARLMKYVQG
ncbi:MAG: hypothetical protein KAS32_17410, partial [Candidatus Peribacteraceae bacterium]|nr:hypothetical protein [Candidatus Peribacteraceae bacterium]